MSAYEWWEDYRTEMTAALSRAEGMSAGWRGKYFRETIGGWELSVFIDGDGITFDGGEYGGSPMRTQWESRSKFPAAGLEWLSEALTAAETMTRRHTGCHSHLLVALRAEVNAARKALEIAEVA